jgi:universal stress protein A
MFQAHRILHPTDYSECSRYAFGIATDLARQNQAELLILHVYDSLGAENVTYGEATSKLEPENYRERLAEEVHRLVPAPAGVSVQYVLAEGDPAEEIERVAAQHACDLIVMGTHGRTGLDRLLMGSVAEQVVRRAPCPVLTTRLPQPVDKVVPAEAQARTDAARAR